nr:hypothetical protein [Tanacetum cinerariifolium]
MDPVAKQREETYQVALDIIKNIPFYNAFLISTDVPEIYMQQEILDIFSKVENQEFTVPLSFESLVKFVLELGYKAVLLTEKIKESNAYKMFFSYSIGLIPSKKGRGKGSQKGKSTATSKEPSKKRKKPSKKKQVLHDESTEPEGEPENRQVSIKIRTPRAVVIQETSSVPVKKTKESPRKLKGIKMLYDAAKLELATQKAIKDSRRASRPKHKIESSSEGTSVSLGVPDELKEVFTDSSKGVGTSPKVPDETEYDYKGQSDDDVWGSTDEETNKDKNEDDVSKEEENEEESVNEEAENEEESVSEEENVDEENEEESDDDKRFDITNTDDERTESDSDDHGISKYGKTVAEVEEEETAKYKHEEDDTKGDDQKSEEEPTGDDQATEAEVLRLHVEELKNEVSVKKEEYKDFIHETVANEVENQLTKILPKAVSDFASPVIQKTKKRRTGKETESSKKSSTPKESTKGKPPSKSSKTGKSASTNQSMKEPKHEIDNITREVLVGLVFNLLKGTCKSGVELEYNMEVCYRVLTYQLDWINPKGHLRSFDMSKPPPLQDKERRLVIAIEILFNNDLEYLTTRNKERSYSSSIMKAPAARDMINMMSKQKVFSTMRILSVVSVQMKNKQGYGYLKEIVVGRADQNLYKFKEGDFPNLHLNDIEDMLLLIAQNMLCNLDDDVIVDFVTALKLFTRGIVLKNRVKDEDTKKQKRLMRVDELHKFSDGTLQYVYKTLLHRLKNVKLGYNRNSNMPMREWIEKDQKRT